MDNKKNSYDGEKTGKCFFCKKEFLVNSLTLHNLSPWSLLEDDSANNWVLCCPECNIKKTNKRTFQELEFVNYLKTLIKKHPDFRNLKQEDLISSKARYKADILVEQQVNGNWKRLLIEVKSTPTFTKERLDEIINQLTTFKLSIEEEIKLVLSFPGILPEEDNIKLRRSNIEVWDLAFISKTFKKEFNNSNSKSYQVVFSLFESKPQIEETLINELKLIPVGKDGWMKYQKHIEKILLFLFCDVLSDPITELPDKYGINRRDFILRNYCETGFWKYIREKYQADFIVIDAKNYSGKITKNQVLQISNYIKSQGTGLFAIIISRNGQEDRGSYYTRLEKWTTERKMIIILDDNDIEKMILSKASLNKPEEIIIQKIESFRLSI